MGNSNGKPISFNDDVCLNHFRLLRVVGKGAFGKVRIVERKDTGLTFALKYIRKDEVVRSESVRNIIRERRMLEHLNHQFLCNLRYSFQDIEYMYLVVDLMNGGDLRFHLSRRTFTEEAVRFWISELGCALRYIHGQGIIHRDVKPDNVLLDSEGHVHLADFNVACDFVKGKLMTSKSGTLAYLAPEVYKGTGYSNGVDWWSLGVLFYECIYNKRPFEGNSQDALSAQIQAASPKYYVTQPAVSMPCLHAISSALEPDPSKRMGAIGFDSFTNNPFFRPIDFERLERKEIEPIFVPSSEKTNFDATYDLEELLLEEAPLEARARRQKPREQLKDDATEKEIREDELFKMIETQFMPFDYTRAAYDRLALAMDPALGPAPEVIDQAGIVPGSKTPDMTPSPGLQPRDKFPTVEAPPAPAVHASHPLDALYNDIDADEFPRRPKTSGQVRNFSQPVSLTPYQQSYTASRNLRPGGNAKESAGGGLQMVLDETSDWSSLAKQDATLPADAKDLAQKPNGGMLSFLNRKKGRGHSPKPREKGVLGKEGARVIIS